METAARSIEERLSFVDAVWGEFLQPRRQTELSEAQSADLERRLSSLDGGLDEASIW